MICIYNVKLMAQFHGHEKREDITLSPLHGDNS